MEDFQFKGSPNEQAIGDGVEEESLRKSLDESRASLFLFLLYKELYQISYVI